MNVIKIERQGESFHVTSNGLIASQLTKGEALETVAAFLFSHDPKHPYFKTLEEETAWNLKYRHLKTCEHSGVAIEPETEGSAL